MLDVDFRDLYILEEPDKTMATSKSFPSELEDPPDNSNLKYQKSKTSWRYKSFHSNSLIIQMIL